ncbi:hypothetical protein ACFL13_02760 [Patescibacteria group bacterium]
MKKFLSAIVIFLAFSIFFSVPVSAQADPICNPPKQWYDSNSGSFGANIRKTTVNHLVSSVTDFSFKSLAGAELSEYMKCMEYFASNYSGLFELNTAGSINCSGTPTEICESLDDAYNFKSTSGVMNPTAFEKFRKGKASGSLLGMVYALEHTSNYEPIPVNMAFFFQDVAKRIPFVNQTAFAQAAVYGNLDILEPILEIWKVVRNFSFGIMAVIMLYVGIAIIVRKQINPQTVVTVQYALPKIILALILIAFSYPIGAAMTGLGWSLMHSADEIMTSMFSSLSSSAANLGAGVSLGAIIILLIGGILAAGAAGPVVFLVGLGGILVLIVTYIRVLIKRVLILLKMLYSTVIAPLEFSIYAIPGNEARLTDWFKKMSVHMLSLLALGVVPRLVQEVGAHFVSWETSGIGSLVLYLFVPIFVFIYGYTLAAKMPEKIEAAIMGPKTGGKRK